jgi:hypothetical protein
MYFEISSPVLPMKRCSLYLILPLCAAVTAFASDYRQSVGVGALEIFHVGVSATVSGPADPSTAPRTSRDYIDGFNRVDSSGNLGEGAPGLPSRTSNFGFTSNQQVDLQRGTLALHTSSPGDSQYFERSSIHGRAAAEIYYRIIRDRRDDPIFGFEARAGYVDVDYSSSDTLNSSVRLLTDTYALGGVVPQPAPYTGSFTVTPGTQRIGDTPTRSTSTVAATIQGHREFSAKGWLLRLGLLWQPIHTPNFELQLHGGPAALNVKGEFRLDERWISSGSPTLTQTAAGERSKWLAGFYAGATARLHVNERWDLFAGADLLHASSLAVNVSTATAKFDFSRSILASAGVAFRF